MVGEARTEVEEAIHREHTEREARLAAAWAALPRPTEADLAPLPGCERCEELAVMWRPHAQWAAVVSGDARRECLLVRAGALPWWPERWPYYDGSPEPEPAATWPEAVAMVLAAWDADRGLSC